MIGQEYPHRTDVPEVRERVFDITGNGTGAPTANQAAGATVTRAALGDLKITFKESPGKFVAYRKPSLRSATGTDLKNFDVVVLNYDATNFVIELLVFNASGTATDLTSSQSVSLAALFKRTGVS